MRRRRRRVAAERGGGDTSADTGDDQSGGAGEKSVTDYVEYIGGKAGKADPNKSTIYIGWLNQQGGQQEIGAAATDGADLAVKVANEQLGGIDGHPVALKKCFIKNAEEEGTTCGQKLGNDKDVSAINVGGVAIGIQPFYSTIGGKKPVIVGVAVTPVDGVQDNATVLFGDATTCSARSAPTRRLGAQTAALVYRTSPGITDGAAALDKGLKAAGVDVKKVGYAQGQTDLIGPLTGRRPERGHRHPLQRRLRLRQPGQGAEAAGHHGRQEDRVRAALPQPDGLGGARRRLPDLDLRDRQLAVRRQDRPGHARLHEGDRAVRREDRAGPVGDRVVRQRADDDQVPQRGRADSLTSDAIIEKARSFTGPVALGAPELQCEKYEDAPAICNDWHPVLHLFGEESVRQGGRVAATARVSRAFRRRGR